MLVFISFMKPSFHLQEKGSMVLTDPTECAIAHPLSHLPFCLSFLLLLTHKVSDIANVYKHRITWNNKSSSPDILSNLEGMSASRKAVFPMFSFSPWLWGHLSPFQSIWTPWSLEPKSWAKGEMKCLLFCQHRLVFRGVQLFPQEDLNIFLRKPHWTRSFLEEKFVYQP